MRRSPRGPVAVAMLLLSGSFSGLAAQQRGDQTISRPDRWFVSSVVDQATNERTHRMLYLGRDGTMLVVQCAARDGLKTGGWSFMLRRDDWSFPTDFVEGWWAVDSEPLNGPLQWGGTGSLVLLNDDDLKERLQQPVQSQIRLRVARGAREWNLELEARDLADAVERFAPSCRVA